LSAKPTALEAVPTGQPGEKCPFREHASTFLVPVQHHTGTSQCGSSLAIPLRVSDEWHRIAVEQPLALNRATVSVWASFTACHFLMEAAIWHLHTSNLVLGTKYSTEALVEFLLTTNEFKNNNPLPHPKYPQCNRPLSPSCSYMQVILRILNLPSIKMMVSRKQRTLPNIWQMGHTLRTYQGIITRCASTKPDILKSGSEQGSCTPLSTSTMTRGHFRRGPPRRDKQRCTLSPLLHCVVQQNFLF